MLGNCSELFIVSTEVHQNPDKLEEWAFSFLYDEKGEDGDVMRVGPKEDMIALQNKVHSSVVGKEYDEALTVLKAHEGGTL